MRRSVLVSRAAVLANFVLLGLAVAFAAMNGRPFVLGDALFLLMTALAVAGISVVGSLIVRREPRNLVGWVLLGSSLGLAGQSAAFDYISLSRDRFDLGLPATIPVAWVDNWLMIPSLIGLVILVPLLFPTGKLPSPRWRPVGVFAGIGITMVTIGSAVAPGPMQAGGIDNPLAVRLPHPLLDIVSAIDGVSGIALFLFAAVAVIVRYRRGSPLERLQLRWFAYPATLGIVGIGLSNIVTAGVLGDALWIGGLLCIAAIPFAIGIAILRHGLFDIDLVIKRTIGYGVLTVLLGSVEVAGVLLLQELLASVTSDQTFAVAATTLGVAALFSPARRRIQAWVDRRFDRSRYDAARIVDGFGARLRGRVDLDDVRLELAAVAQVALRPTSVSIWMRSGTQEDHP
jgi:hypothetical protein